MTDPVKDLSLEQIEELLAKTTSGEWHANFAAPSAWIEFGDKLSEDVLATIEMDLAPFEERKANAEFIAQSKQIVQSLIRRVREMEGGKRNE